MQRWCFGLLATAVAFPAIALGETKEQPDEAPANEPRKHAPSVSSELARRLIPLAPVPDEPPQIGNSEELSRPASTSLFPPGTPVTAPAYDMFQIAEALRQLEIPLPQAASGVSQKIVGGAPFRAQLGRFSTLRTSGQNSNKVVGATIVNGEVVDALPANPPSPVSNSADDVFVDPYEDVVAVGSVEAWSCSGVVVSPRHILTAAHCLPATRIAVGYRTDAPKMAVQVSRTSRHKRADAAILELAEEIPVSPRSRRRASHSRAPYGDAVLVGFGAEDHAGERGHGVMRKASTPLAGWGCDGARPDTIRCNPEFEMVIPGSGKTDTCNGDSGGPVFENVAGESRLLAITSRPIPTTAAPCGRGGIYVRVDKISDWILQQMDPPTLSTP